MFSSPNKVCSLGMKSKAFHQASSAPIEFMYGSRHRKCQRRNEKDEKWSILKSVQPFPDINIKIRLMHHSQNFDTTCSFTILFLIIALLKGNKMYSIKLLFCFDNLTLTLFSKERVAPI